MSEPKSIEEVPNWVIMNALRCPIEAQISIIAKLLQHLDRDQRIKALSMSGVSESLFFTRFDLEKAFLAGTNSEDFEEWYQANYR